MKMTIPAGAACLAALLASAPARADSDAQLWLVGSATIALSDKVRLAEEANIRFSDDRNGLYEVENILLLGYRLSPKTTIWAGYVHDPLYTAGKFTTMEHRVREQVTFDNIAKIGAGTLSLRMRAEQRWREETPGTAWRLRPFARYALPLGKGGTSLQLSHESFINLDTNSYQKLPGWERMRNLAAVRTPIAKTLTLELGYMNQFTRMSGRSDQHDHAAYVALAASF